MPLLRITARQDQPMLADPGADLTGCLGQALRGPGPVLILLHGFRYTPDIARHCPHRTLFSLEKSPAMGRCLSWPLALGFGQGQADEGLCISFGWHAQGTIWNAYDQAAIAGKALARLICRIHDLAPHRNVQILAHSLGVRVGLCALPFVPERAVFRFVSLAGAEFCSRAQVALGTAGGTEFINVTSRENDLFDYLLERLIPAPRSRDRVLGHAALKGPSVVSLQLDDAGTLARLATLGFDIAPSRRRICHWSLYMRPGIFGFYRALFDDAQHVPLTDLRQVARALPAPRWSRLLSPPRLGTPLPLVQKTTS